MPLPPLSRLLHESAWRRRWAWLCATLVLAVGALALTPGSAAATLSSNDKFDHLLAFSVLAATAALATRRGLRHRLAVATLLVAYGGFIELAQTQIPGRFGNWADLLADSVGVALGLGLVPVLRRFWPPATARTAVD